MHAACTTATLRPPTFRLAPRPALYAFLSTRQGASSFNQPLSLDTSSVTTMFGMFYVRSPALYLRRCHLMALPLPDPGLTSPRLTSPLLPTRQSASAFNQPLSLDTSSVTTMSGMFWVRSPALYFATLWPSLFLTSPRLTSPLLPTRQSASAFNQLLSLDTSSVTTMQGMFYVRSPARCLDGPRVSAHTSHLAPHRIPPFDSAGSVDVQPAAEFRHV